MAWFLITNRSQADLLSVSASVVALQAVTVLLLAAVWSRLIVGSMQPKLVHSFTKAQLAKYLPTGVANIATQVWDANALAGRGYRDGLKKFAASMALMALGAVLISLMRFHWALLPISLAAISTGIAVAAKCRYSQDLGQHKGLKYGHFLTNIGVSTLAVFIFATSFALHARQNGILQAESFTTIVSAFSLAWIIGLIVVVAPAGIGVRETALAVILGNSLTVADSFVLSAGHRLGQALAEITTFAAVWVFRAMFSTRDVRATADSD